MGRVLHARTLGTPSLGPSIPGMKSILGPIQLKGLTMVNSRPFSAPSAAMKTKLMRACHIGYYHIITNKSRTSMVTVDEPLD
ncbi:hypothetical protein Hanom_Chr11g01047931 [Helianthus anomalus]